MRALLIKTPWIELILKGQKTWEIRSRKSSVRGRIALIKSQSGKIFGTVEMVACHGPFTKAEIMQHVEKHCVSAELMHVVDYKEFYAWEFRDAHVFKEPLPYQHPSGAVIWVTLTDDNVPAGLKSLQ